MMFFLIPLISSLFTSSISLALPVGMAVGAYYFYTKKYDMNGDSYYEYEEATRLYGKVIFVGCTAILLIKLALFFY